MPRCYQTLLLICLSLGWSGAALCQGSTRGITSPDPSMSVGIHVGNWGGAGISAQKVGFMGGAANFGIGLGFGVDVFADYIRFYDGNIGMLDLADDTTYRQFRGKWLPYFGVGAQIGQGAQLRFPFGVQYTMLEDPVDFFGGAGVVAGNDISGEDFAAGVFITLGVRILI